ncbi:hypothetical protein AAHE18_10G081600 [Arachis hypogaea]
MSIYPGSKKNGAVYMFAFIRYTTKGGALKAITDMNRLQLRGKVLLVQETKYRRTFGAMDTGNGRRGNDTQNQPILKPYREVGEGPSLTTAHNSRTKEAVETMHQNGEIKKMEAIVAPENLNWLQRSLVGVTTRPIDFSSLREMLAISLPSVVQIREMGACKALLTFDNVMHADEAYTFKLNSLLQAFHRVWKWKDSERNDTRRVWLECFGISLSVWSTDTFNMIGRQWGTVVRCAKETELCSNFTVGRVQIDMCALDVIQERIHITVGSRGYDVLVKEVGREACNLQCEGDIMDNEVTNCETNPRPAKDACQRRQPCPSKAEGKDEELMTVVQRGVDEDKDRLVISDNILNEWNKCSTNHNRDKIVTHLFVNGNNQGGCDFGGETGASDEADSDRTVTYVYGDMCNGPRRGIKKVKQNNKGVIRAGLRKQICCYLGNGSALGLCNRAGHDPVESHDPVEGVQFCEVEAGSTLGLSLLAAHDPVRERSPRFLLPHAQQQCDLVWGAEPRVGDGDCGSRQIDNRGRGMLGCSGGCGPVVEPVETLELGKTVETALLMEALSLLAR